MALNFSDRDFIDIKLKDIKLKCFVKGTGEPLLLIHGWPECWYSWRYQIDFFLKNGYQIIAPDIRGFGSSEKPASLEKYEMKYLISDILEIISFFNNEEVILVGHDWGAPIAWNTAALYPKKVKGVVGLSVPYSPRGKISSTKLWNKIYKNKFFYQNYFQKKGIAEKELDQDIKLNLKKIFFALSGDAEVNFFENKSANSKMLDEVNLPKKLPNWLSLDDINYYFSQYKEKGFGSTLNRYRVQHKDWENLISLQNKRIIKPSCFICGSKEPVLKFIPGFDAIDYMKKWTDKMLICKIIDGVGHWVHQESHKIVNETILDFILTVERNK